MDIGPNVLNLNDDEFDLSKRKQFIDEYHANTTNNTCYLTQKEIDFLSNDAGEKFNQSFKQITKYLDLKAYTQYSTMEGNVSILCFKNKLTKFDRSYPEFNTSNFTYMIRILFGLEILPCLFPCTIVTIRPSNDFK